MEKWRDKVAVVTGGNSGCGLKIVENLAKNGLIVVSLDLKDDEIDKLKSENEKIHTIKCDITLDDSVNLAFEWIEKHLNGVDILINNAGISNNFGIFDHDKPMLELKKCVEVNFIATIHCSRLAYKSMMKRDSHGCIININSVAGHRVMDMGKCKLGLYTSSKYAITSATELMRIELNSENNKKIRVSSISPGLIDTPLFKSSNLPTTILEHMEEKMEKLKTEDISDMIIFVLSMPYRINISELIIRATGSTF